MKSIPKLTPEIVYKRYYKLFINFNDVSRAEALLKEVGYTEWETKNRKYGMLGEFLDSCTPSQLRNFYNKLYGYDN